MPKEETEEKTADQIAWEKARDEELELIRLQRETYTNQQRDLWEEQSPGIPMPNALGETELTFLIDGVYVPEHEARIIIQEKKIAREYRKLMQFKKEKEIHDGIQGELSKTLAKKKETFETVDDIDEALAKRKRNAEILEKIRKGKS